MKIKLPRKRKKAYIKKHSRYDYIMMSITGEVLFEETGKKDCLKFPEFSAKPTRGKYKVLFYW